MTSESKTGAAALFFEEVCMHSSRGSCIGSGGLHVCRGSSLWFSSFGLVFCALCSSLFLSRLCRAVALA
jgi:hypothetical protein